MTAKSVSWIGCDRSMPWMVAPSTAPVGSTRIIASSQCTMQGRLARFEVVTKVGVGPSTDRILSVHICGYLCVSLFLFAFATAAKSCGRACDRSVQQSRNIDTHRYPQINATLHGSWQADSHRSQACFTLPVPCG